MKDIKEIYAEDLDKIKEKEKKLVEEGLAKWAKVIRQSFQDAVFSHGKLEEKRKGNDNADAQGSGADEDKPETETQQIDTLRQWLAHTQALLDQR